MSGTCRLVNCWGPVIALMALIFVGSTDLLSSRHTSRFIEPFLRWLIPGISPAALERVHLAVRKSGHLTEYGVLAALLWRARRKTSIHEPQGGARRLCRAEPRRSPRAGAPGMALRYQRFMAPRRDSGILEATHAPRAWLWSQAAFALCTASLYAASDEYHQSFYPSRGASVEDVVIDTVGAAVGLALLWVLGRWRKQW
ncbi:MAG: VanZ family protein [Limisphaerales bacterium]